ncbi:MAG: ADP-ribosylglycohydrolase family protein [Spirochaetales bacterium]|nr:ADP-ribosylglycohydrolase family protein [Spirochaetales bacterium]
MFRKVLEALAVGDAMGMPTEFMTRDHIKKNFGIVDTILDPEVSDIHRNLKMYSVTDDTEQNLYLIEEYCRDGVITVENTVAGLLRWIKETNAEEKGYIGPSSLRALRGIEKGEDPYKAGVKGVTCGAPMRALAPALCASEKNLVSAVYSCCIPTHNNNLAVEAAMAVGYAIHKAMSGGSYDEIINASLEGARVGAIQSKNIWVGPSTEKRISLLLSELPKMKNLDDLLDYLYYIIGTGLDANQVAPAIIGLFAWAKDDVWLAIKAGASVGGDTDTIAAVTASLSALYRKGHNIPDDILHTILKENDLKIGMYADMIKEHREKSL